MYHTNHSIHLAPEFIFFCMARRAPYTQAPPKKAAWIGQALERQRGKTAWKGSLEGQYGPVLQNLCRRQEWHQKRSYGKASTMQISM